jgi:Protein of unknown function (DUF3662)/FHA domain
VPILRDFERRLGGLVEGFFATTFRSGLQPVELAKRLMREMDSGKTVGVREVWAPNRYVFTLSEQDGQRFEQAEQALVNELKQVVRDAAAERGWGLVGPPEVEFEVDDGLGKGRFGCVASFVEGEEELPPQPAAGGRGSLVSLTDGRSRALDRPSMTIGRLPECDVVVDDAGASRQHAELRRTDDGFVLSDLGSTNGTLVNGAPIREHLLEDGDRITIGETVLEFRSG